MRSAASEMAPASPPLLERVLIAYARHFPLRKGKLRLVDRLWRVAAASQGTARIADLSYGGLKMPCDLSEMLQRQFYFFGTYFLEEDLLAAWGEAARTARVIVDAGANSGIYSLAALAARPDAKVHAFEPTPEIARRLAATAGLNGLANLAVYPVALSHRDGRATLRRWRGEFGTNEGMNYIVADESDGSERVETMTLDRFCREQRIDCIDLMKLDVQGHEASVLAGATGILAAGGLRQIFLELNWADAGADCPATRCVRILSDAGFEFRAAKEGGWREAGTWLRHMPDVIARRRDC